MSNCTIIQTHNEIYIGSDSAVSTIINGNIYRLNEDGKKLFLVDDLVLFCSGNLELSYEIISQFKETDERNINVLQSIASNLFNQYLSFNPSVTLDILATQVKNNESIVYQISPYSNFDIVKNLVPQDYFAVWSGGIKTKESFEITNKQIFEGKVFCNIFQNTFDNISFEGIGGILTVYKVSNNGIEQYYRNPINETNIKKITIDDLPKLLIVGEQIYGKLGVFAKIRSDQIIISPDGSETTIGGKIDDGLFDVETEVKKYAGDKDTQLRNDLRLENPLPSSMRLNNLGLHVDDQNGNNRVRLGQYATGKYGLLIRNKTGNATILDEDGIMQTWQEGRTDNVDSGYPLTLYVYVPPETRLIRKSILRFKLLPFRAYSRGTSSGGGTYSTTGSGGGVYTSTGWGGGQLTSTYNGGGTNATSIALDWEPGWNGHDHGIPNGTALLTYGGGSVGWVKSGQHSHTVSIPNHSHTVEIPSHDHSVSIGDHYHSISVPEHTHGINYGIYTSTTPYAVTVYINGYNRTYNLGGSFNYDQSNLDITNYLNIGQWNTIELGTSRLGRIDATVFVQAFIGM